MKNLTTCLLLFAASCGDAGRAEDDHFDWVAGDYPADPQAQSYLEIANLPGQGGRTRGYKVHLPASYDASKPTPVVYAIHGFTQDAVGFAVKGSDFIQTSDENGFVLVMPNGIQGEDVLGGSWNAGSCCGTAGNEHLDDVAFFRAIHAQLREHVNVDPRRVYATGFSNGGFMANRLACEASDIFVAIAPLAGAIGIPGMTPFALVTEPDFKACKPSQHVSVLLMHGTADPLVRYANVAPTFEHWASVDGCGTTTVPATQPRSGGDTTCVTYEGCPEGVEVTSCSVQGGGHCFFGDPACGTGAGDLGSAIVGNNSDTLHATRDAWAFLSRFER